MNVAYVSIFVLGSTVAVETFVVDKDLIFYNGNGSNSEWLPIDVATVRCDLLVCTQHCMIQCVCKRSGKLEDVP